jgi:flagellar motor switch protein FliN
VNNDSNTQEVGADGATAGTADQPMAEASVAQLEAPQPPVVAMRPLETLSSVELPVIVELGRTRLLMKDLLGLRPGSVVELDRHVGAPVDVFVNSTLLAQGEVVVVDDELGVRITAIAGGSDDTVGA